MKNKLKVIFLRIIYSIFFSLTIALIKHMLSSLEWYSDLKATVLACVLTPFLVAFMDMPSSGGSSSHVPQSEPSVNQAQAPDPTAPAEPVAPDPDVYQPLLDDNTRRAELYERAGFHFLQLPDEVVREILDNQVKIEKAIEKALLSDGYSRDELNEQSKRNEIRGHLFYPQGKLLGKKYERYIKEIEFGTHRSFPYKQIINAISSSKLDLTKVKKIKRWQLGIVWDRGGKRR